MTGERVAVTSNGREYTWRGTRWTYEPKNNHGRTEVHRTSRLHFALCELASIRAQVAALAVVMDALGEESINCDNLHHGPKDYHAAFSEPCPVQARVKAALDAARGGEG